MITGFDDITHELTAEESGYVKYVCDILKQRIGKDLAITNGEISRMLKSRIGDNVTGPRMRKIINFIRRAGMVPCLLSNSQGYFVSYNELEVQAYIKSLTERADAIRQVAISLKRQFKDTYSEELFPNVG